MILSSDYFPQMTNQLFHQNIQECFCIKIKNSTHIINLVSIVRGHNLIKIIWNGCMLFWGSLIHNRFLCLWSIIPIALSISLCRSLYPGHQGVSWICAVIHEPRSSSSVLIQFAMFMGLLCCLISDSVCETFSLTFSFFLLLP